MCCMLVIDFVAFLFVVDDFNLSLAHIDQQCNTSKYVG
ncbi:hypothetical protein MuYL_3679 [Mucilaginibacter xinganensis]|uniref:Uncharacterized protein n=1 Tax=Mucilaginibacter xinganensis TaxID=1234841 RepID=A0A223P0U0_9SPHI|nr:hypothetical protein MuYL_3679 [Mucilaginibacter xinganensis]